jgi:hypothetical protein
MTQPEKQITAAIEELKEMAEKTTGQIVLAGLDIIISGLETMRPYVRVGLRVSPSDETLEAMKHLHDDGMLTEEQWHTLMETLRLARYGLTLQPATPASLARPVAA